MKFLVWRAMVFALTSQLAYCQTGSAGPVTDGAAGVSVSIEAHPLSAEWELHTAVLGFAEASELKPLSGGPAPGLEPYWGPWKTDGKIYGIIKSNDRKLTSTLRHMVFANVIMIQEPSLKLKSTWRILGSAAAEALLGAIESRCFGSISKEITWTVQFHMAIQPFAGDVTIKLFSEIDKFSFLVYRELMKPKWDRVGNRCDEAIGREQEWPCIEQVSTDPGRQHFEVTVASETSPGADLPRPEWPRVILSGLKVEVGGVWSPGGRP